MLKDLRRIVTGHDSKGRSIVVLNAPPAKMRGTDTMGLGDAWIAESVPADNSVFKDLAPEWPQLAPPNGGARIAWFWLGKDDPNRQWQRSGDTAIIMDDTKRHPSMHRTNTQDYVVLISGRMRMLLDEGHVDLNPGDVVVQRGTNHAWTNLYDEPAVLLSVMMDAVPGVGENETIAASSLALPPSPFSGLKRVVTGHDARGRAVALVDGAPANAIATPEAGLIEIWQTPSLPADMTDARDLSQGKVLLEPAPQSVKVRWFWLAPENPAVPRAAIDAAMAGAFSAIGASHARVDTSKHPSMHKTHSLDFIVMLKGDVTLLLDEGEVTVKPGDVVVQRGTNHGWVNKGKEPALLLAVLADAR